MKIKNKLTILGVGLAATFVFSSCGDKKELDEKTKEVTEQAVPTDAKGIATAAVNQMEKIIARLESVTDVESAKKALPDVNKMGAFLKKLQTAGDKIGGEDKFKEVLDDLPKVKEKFKANLEKMQAKMTSLGKKSPEALKIINEALAKFVEK